jgi:hypothetical protein
MIATAQDLLPVWCEIYQEAVQLCEAIERLPDQCECGDAEAHLEGRCRCCGKDKAAHGHGENCRAILTRLRADLSMFCQDFAAISVPLATGVGPERRELRRGIFLAASDLQQIVKGVNRVNEAVPGFRRTCDLAELRGLKRHSAELREHLNNVQLKLEGK